MTTTSDPLGRRYEIVHLYRPDDLHQLRILTDALQDTIKAAGVGAALAGDAARIIEAQDAYNTFRDEALTRAVQVRVEAVGRLKFRELKQAHPPRETHTDDGQGGTITVPHEDDEQRGVNAETFPDALVPVSITEPVFATDSDRQAWIDDLSDGDFERLYETAYYLNRRSPNPKALPPIDLTGKNAAT